MSILHLVLLATEEPPTENFWQFLLHHPAFDVGFLVFMGGTAVGNIGVSKMSGAIREDSSAKHEMFAVGEETKAQWSLVNPAVEKYQEKYPDGPLYRILQLGWVLNALGAVIVIGSIFL